MHTLEEKQLFIIGGTIKAATTSLFNYLNAHPQVCGSKVKETYFFSQGYTGNVEHDRKKYTDYFSPQAESRVLFEASPNYLAYKENVAPRIKELFPDAKLVFILRNPVERLYSHFHFARGKLQVPEQVDFEEFIGLCNKFDTGEITAEQAGIIETHLRAMEIGNYGKYLQNFYDVFDANSIKVIFFDDLNKNPLTTLTEISEFIGVDPSFYESFSLDRVNVTFSAKRKGLHYFVLILNRLLESVLRQRPELKKRLVKIYKYFNQSKQGYVPMQSDTRDKLVKYYVPSNAKVKQVLKGQPVPQWVDFK